jgi:hypothetical protein
MRSHSHGTQNLSLWEDNENGGAHDPVEWS